MLSINNLEVVYNKVMLVLQGVSLEVPEGKVVTLLGPNGAGKTTMLRAITGLLDIHDGDITQGTVKLAGEDVAGLGADQIVTRGLAQVMEGRRILAELSVEENLMAGAFLAPDRERVRADVRAMYERFPILGERKNQSAGYLSGGEQQMLAIARALVSRPKILLLDEPSLGLAPKIVADVAALVRELNADGMTILLIEQNASLALSLAHYGYIIENGRVVHDGTSEALRADEDIQEFYMGVGGGERKSYREVKHYRRRKRWLS